MSKAEVAQHFLGMDFSPIFLVNGCPTLDISQPGYTCMLIEQYRELFEFNGAFRSFKTPAEDHDVSFLGTGPDADTVGAHAAGAPRLVGGLLYLVRCSRPDCSFVAGKLGRWTTRWTEGCEKVLHRLMCYLYHTRDHKLRMTGRDDVNSSMFIVAFTDADHAGEVATSHSTSGACLFIMDTSCKMRCLIGWRSKKQNVTAFSTGEAEAVATAELVKTLLLPCLGTFDNFMPLPALALGDASVVERCLQAGWSKNMRYLRKHQRVSISLLHDVFHGDRALATFGHTSSETNVAGIFTKALPVASVRKHVSFLGIEQIASLPNSEADTSKTDRGGEAC